MKSPNISELNSVQKLEVEVIIVIFILLLGSSLFSMVEHIPFFRAFYFSVITLAGIGYGDIVPTTVGGKIIVMIYAFIGLPLFVSMGYLISSIISVPLKRTRKKAGSKTAIEYQLEHAEPDKRIRNK